MCAAAGCFVQMHESRVFKCKSSESGSPSWVIIFCAAERFVEIFAFLVMGELVFNLKWTERG